MSQVDTSGSGGSSSSSSSGGGGSVIIISIVFVFISRILRYNITMRISVDKRPYDGRGPALYSKPEDGILRRNKTENAVDDKKTVESPSNVPSPQERCERPRGKFVNDAGRVVVK